MRARRLTLGLMTAVLLAAWPVAASDTPLRGPAPAWAAPSPADMPGADTSGAPVRFTLLDQQVRFDAEGKHLYLRMRIHIQSAQGLAAGSVVAAWSPATQTLTFHNVSILRGDTVIDAMEGRQFDILRREQNLASAMYDGILTATLQPRDLRVGDVLDVAYTLTTRDTVLGDHAEHLIIGALPFPIERFRAQASWPASTPMRLRAAAPMDEPRVIRDGDRRRIEIDLRDLQPLSIPQDAPVRFHQARLLELSDYSGWGEMGRVLSPLYRRASTLEPDSPLLVEIERIRRDHDTLADRVSAALRLVQDDVRYVAFVMGEAGLTPASADEVWRERLGDCKGKTVLLMALLRHLGVEAEAVAVSTVFGDGLDQRLPLVALLDHVVVRTVIDGRTYWLDGAREGDVSIAAAPSLPYSWALPLTDDSAGLEPIPLPPLDTPQVETVVSIDASAGLEAPAPTRGENILRGDDALSLHLALQSASAADRDEYVRAAWSAVVPNLEIDRTESTFDAATGELRLIVDGRTTLSLSSGPDGRRRFEAPAVRAIIAFGAERSPGPYADLPFSTGHPMFHTSRVGLTLPNEGAGFTLSGADFEHEFTGAQMRRSARIEDGRLIAALTVRSLRSEIPAADMARSRTEAPAVRNDRLWVQAPANYVATEQDRDALRARQSTTAEDYVNQGLALQAAGDSDGALQAFEQAMALDPDSANAVANRGIILFWKDDLERARADFDRASDLDPSEVVALNGHGLLAIREERFDDAVIEFSRVLRQRRNDPFALSMRAQAYAGRGDFDRALADLDALAAQNAGGLWSLGQRYLMLLQAERRRDALATLDQMLAAEPEHNDLRLERAILAYGLDKDAAAARVVVADVLAQDSSARNHVVSARLRDPTDLEGRRADLDAAIAQNRHNREAITDRIMLEIDDGDPAAALEIIDEAQRRADAAAQATETPLLEVVVERQVFLTPLLDSAESYGPYNDTAFLRSLRAEALIAADRLSEAEADLAVLRAEAEGSANDLNNLCWIQATRGAFLEQALADCEAALALEPTSAAILDSRGMALLHLDRPAEALADYEAALAQSPRMAPALYGRAFARRALGQTEAAQADFTAAAAIDEQAREGFKVYEERRTARAD